MTCSNNQLDGSKYLFMMKQQQIWSLCWKIDMGVVSRQSLISSVSVKMLLIKQL